MTTSFLFSRMKTDTETDNENCKKTLSVLSVSMINPVIARLYKTDNETDNETDRFINADGY